MFKQLTLGLTALAIGASALAPTAASAQRYGGGYYGQDYGQSYDRYGRGDDRAYGNAYRDGYNRGPHYYRDRGYRDNRRCSDGTTGTIIGAIAGGLLGRAVDNHGDRATGTILGGVGGALAGRAIDRNGNGDCYRR